MDISTIVSIQNQLVTHINKTIKASTDEEIVVDKTILVILRLKHTKPRKLRLFHLHQPILWMII